MSKCYFITGTDTEVGKTTTSIALLKNVQLAGFTAAGYKPVASGIELTIEGFQNSDILALKNNSNILINQNEIYSYIFNESTSPHIASANENRPILTSLLSKSLNTLKSKVDFLFVEGVGGWLTPISKTTTLADWVIEEKLSVIMVVGIKIGCINHALLTALSIRQAGLNLAGWVANKICSKNKWYNEYLKTLKEMIFSPFLGEIPWLNSIEKKESLGKYLNIKNLK